MNYGELMKEIRFYNDVTQKDVANILGLQRSTYSDYEQQYIIIPLKHLLKFCNHFNISLDYIFGLTNTKQYPNNKKEIDLKEFGIRLRRLRKEHKLNQGELAKKIHTHNTILSSMDLCQVFRHIFMDKFTNLSYLNLFQFLHQIKYLYKQFFLM